MLKAFLIFLKIAVVVAAAVLLADYPGRVSIEWQGWRIDMSLAVLVVAAILVAILAAVLYRFYGGVLAAPGRFLSARRASRTERGYRALTQGLVALAAGDADEARRQARRAESLLANPPITRLLTAQTAQLDGDATAAKRYFEEMLEDPETAFLGLRGLLTQALAEGDRAAALRLAERANELRPGTPWVVRHLIELKREADDVAGALATLEGAERRRALPRPETQATKARLLAARARESQAEGDIDGALKLALKAHKADPALIEATAMAARLNIAKNKRRRAEKLIEEAWVRAPDPALARAYAEAAPDGASALDQVKRFERLLSLKPDHPEGHIALAEAALKAELWGAARSHLTKAGGDRPGPRVCRLMAELEESEHGDLAKAREWLARATGEIAETETGAGDPDGDKAGKAGGGALPAVRGDGDARPTPAPA